MSTVSKRFACGLSGKLAEPMPDYKIAIPCILTAMLLLARAPDAFLKPQFWAEDGAIFFAQQYTQGAWAILKPHAGYLHLVPRLTALTASLFPASFAPTIYVFAYLAVAVWTSALVAGSGVRNAPLLASLLLAVPYSNEILGTITNVQWLMAPALLIIAIAPTPASLGWKVSRLVFAISAAFSGPFVLIISPLYVLRYAKSRNSYSTALLGIVVAACLANGYCLARSAAAPDSLHPAAVEFLINGFHRWLALLPIGTFVTNFLQAFAVLLFVAAVLFVATSAPNKTTAVTFLAFGTAIMVAAALRRPEPFAFHRLDWSDRYFYLPLLMLIWTMAAAIRPPWTTGVIAAVALAVALNPAKLGTQLVYSRGTMEDFEWKAWASQIGKVRPLEIPINPRPWTVDIR
jgi:hypothetical protein